jgi:hypothetical protein
MTIFREELKKKLNQKKGKVVRLFCDFSVELGEVKRKIGEFERRY